MTDTGHTTAIAHSGNFMAQAFVMSVREHEGSPEGMDASARVLRVTARVCAACATLADDVTEQTWGRTEQLAAAFDDPRAMVSVHDYRLPDRQTAERQHIAKRERAGAGRMPGANLFAPCGCRGRGHAGAADGAMSRYASGQE
ncbi:hypothetical protein AB3X82_25990 [Paraburkholderia phenoliruptrix]|uniref:Uncharacterized protein n=1 Tax=Paraburkholderia phenoliruptrix TaxID=252970 RepID=A0ABV3WK12_9BURK